VQLRLEDSVLCAEVLDDFVLLALEPTDERRNEHV
jgi:hypothetical protein